ncbi:MAG: DNA-binding MarR family transcriptional regulator [Candidatus Azotimanducaceae bacterium]|jgi:DNA-binding MarR family transcriptional regulator
MEIQDDLADAILIEIRRVVRAIDLDSKQMVRQHGVTGPQLVTLRSVARLGPITVTALARAVNLSQPTVTGILARLEQQGLVRRERDSQDRRAVRTTITDRGRSVLFDTPKPLEDRFRRKLAQLMDWEQTQTLATLQHIAAMMEAENISADPILSTDSLNSASQDTPVLLDMVHSLEKPTGKT